MDCTTRGQDSNRTTESIGYLECGQNFPEITFIDVTEDHVHASTTIAIMRRRASRHNVQFQIREKRFIVENFRISQDAFMLRLVGHCESQVTDSREISCLVDQIKTLLVAQEQQQLS